MQPVLTQVPPNSLRSMIATRHAGGGQPSGERRAGLAGADDDGVEGRAHRQRRDDQQRRRDGDRVLDECGRQVAAEGLGQAAADFGAAERADHRADDAGDQAADQLAAGGADRRAAERAA